VAHFQLAVFDEGRDLIGQFQQAQQVGDGGARTADRVGRLLVRDAEFADEAFEGARLFERVEVFALDVLDERHRNGRFIRHAPDDGRYRGQAGNLGGPPAAFAGDDLVALRLTGRGALHGPDHDGLHDALRLDGRGQFVE
jgi:hypothetical protein